MSKFMNACIIHMCVCCYYFLSVFFSFFGELVLYAVLTRLYMWFFVNSFFYFSFFFLFSGVLMCYFKWQIFLFFNHIFSFFGWKWCCFFCLFIYLYILLYCCCLISVGIPVKNNNIINCILCKSIFLPKKVKK